MKLDDIDINETILNAKKALKKDENISSSTKAVFNLLIMVVSILINRLNLNSANSSKSPSSDPNRKKSNRKKSTNPKGGQIGHRGTNLKQVEDPDKIKNLKIDKRKLPKGKKYTPKGFIRRQVVNIKIARHVIEYRAEVLIDDKGKEYIADFPEGVTRPIQYGSSVKASAAYASNYQLIPYKRIEEQFSNEYNIPLSAGSVYNFNVQASTLLLELGVDSLIKKELAAASQAHADETGINVNSKKLWLHNLSNDEWTWFEPHIKRGAEAMSDIGIIPAFSGVLCHDHWKPYFTYNCKHSLCNAHHLRELICAEEQDAQKWAKKMHTFLTNLNKEVGATKKGTLSKMKIKERTESYRKILFSANKECPAKAHTPGKKGRQKQSKSRNLLERLRDYENEVLRFMVDPIVPFTNNQGERNIRMTKVQQKISGCFRSMDGAVIFCRVRSYLSTCKKNNVPASEALDLLFNRKLPMFIQAKIDSS